MMQYRLGQSLAALVKRLRKEFPGLVSVYRFGSFGTEYGLSLHMEGVSELTILAS